MSWQIKTLLKNFLQRDLWTLPSFHESKSVFLCLIYFHRSATWIVDTSINSVCLPPMWLGSGSPPRPVKLSCVRSGRCQSQVKRECHFMNYSECVISLLILILLQKLLKRYLCTLECVTSALEGCTARIKKWNNSCTLSCLLLEWLFKWPLTRQVLICIGMRIIPQNIPNLESGITPSISLKIHPNKHANICHSTRCFLLLSVCALKVSSCDITPA